MNDEAARLNSLTEQIIAAAIAGHRALGPGLLESAYEACLYHELVTRGLRVERQKPLPFQMLSYLKISGLRVGLVLNFNVKNLSQQGIMRKVNNFPG